ncbi:MAG: hypothetical protein MJE66_10585 [Proteobacteria bacterium]|nr:hypothetical protein [Pseudomonadota bacterium]
MPPRLTPVILALATACVGAATARAQASPSLADLALDWSRGSFATPLYCEIDAATQRGLRRLEIVPGPRHARPPTNSLRFTPLDLPSGTARCFDDLGREELEVAGRLEFRLDGPERRDSALRDFKARLRRDRGFEFRIARGQLQLGAVGESRRRVDFAGGELTLREISPASDEARLLRDLPPGRRLLMTIQAPSGESLRFPMARSRDRADTGLPLAPAGLAVQFASEPSDSSRDGFEVRPHFLRAGGRLGVPRRAR